MVPAKAVYPQPHPQLLLLPPQQQQSINKIIMMKQQLLLFEQQFPIKNLLIFLIFSFISMLYIIQIGGIVLLKFDNNDNK